ncbi:MAG: hypothetical protein WBB64_02730 [Anaerolineales bacterium]
MNDKHPVFLLTIESLFHYPGCGLIRCNYDTNRVDGIDSKALQEGVFPVPGDYDGDGDTEYAVLRPSNGKWFIKDIGTFN